MPLILTQIQEGMKEAWKAADAAAKLAGKPNKEFAEGGGAGSDMPVSASTIDDAAATAFGLRAGLEIDKYIKSADVLPGIAVATAGSAVSQIGSTTAPGKIA